MVQDNKPDLDILDANNVLQNLKSNKQIIIQANIYERNDSNSSSCK